MAKTYASVAADLRTLYTVSYQSPGGRERDGRWREMRVDIDRPEVIARPTSNETSSRDFIL